LVFGVRVAGGVVVGGESLRASGVGGRVACRLRWAGWVRLRVLRVCACGVLVACWRRYWRPDLRGETGVGAELFGGGGLCGGGALIDLGGGASPRRAGGFGGGPEAMNETLRRNLEALGERSPVAAERVARAAARPDVEWFRAVDGAWSAVAGGRALASKRRPLEEASKLAGRVDLSSCGVVAWLGFGVGHHVGALWSRARRAVVQVVFEPDVGLLRAVLERVDFSEMLASRDVVVVTGADESGELSSVLSRSEGMVALGVSIVEHPPSVVRLDGLGAVFGKTLAGVVDAVRTTVVTTMVQTDATLRNLVMNADGYVTRPGIGGLKGSASGRLGVVVSAGPSLSRNIGALRGFGVGAEHGGGAVVVATQTALKPLLEAGVTPHFVTALDFHEVSTRFYEGLDSGALERTVLVVEPKVNPAVVSAYPGPVRFVNDATLDLVVGEELAGSRDSFGEDGALPAGATVAHLAYELARHLGCDRVALVGQDLGFTDGQYYGDGAAIHGVWGCEISGASTLETMEWQRVVRGRGTLREGRDHLGRRVYTDAQMATYLDQFERLFLRDRRAGMSTVDCTEGGLAKRGAPAGRLSEVLSADGRGVGGLDFVAGSEPSVQSAEVRLSLLRERLVGLSRESRSIERASREAGRLLGKLGKCLDDTARANGIIRKVHAERDRVHSMGDAFGLVQRMNQTGAFNRQRQDRAMYIDEGLGEGERRAKQVARDLENVRWTEEAAAAVSRLLDAGAVASAGGEKLTRDSSPPGGGVGVKKLRSCVFVLARAEDARREFLGEAVLSRTLRRAWRLVEEGAARGVVVLIDEEGAAERALVSKVAHASGVRVVVAEDVRTDRERGVSRAFRARHGRTRGLSADAWRSGHAASVWDEALDPEWTLRLMDGAMGGVGKSDAAVVVGGSWCLFDSGLAVSMVERMRETGHPLVFAPAAAGLSACVVGRKLMEDLVSSRSGGSVWASIASVLGYVPTKPRRDPIATTACVGVAPAARDAGVRCAVDGAADVGLLEAALRAAGGSLDGMGAEEIGGLVGGSEAVWEAARPRELVFESGGLGCSGCERGRWFAPLVGEDPAALLDPGLIERVVSGSPGARVTIAGVGGVDGTGDPALHPGLGELIAAARGAGASWVSVRTDLSLGALAESGDERLVALASCDAVELDIVAQTPGVYESLTGRDELNLVKANAQVLWGMVRSEGCVFDGGFAQRALIARGVKCDATYGEVEGLYDAWLVGVGLSVLDPLPRELSAERIGPMREPMVSVRRRALSRVFVRGSGSVWVGEPWSVAFGGSRTEVVGEASCEAFGEVWRRVLERRRELVCAASDGGAARRGVAA